MRCFARACRLKSSRVRSAVLVLLQAMAKADPRALHVHWTTLLPVQHPLQPRPLSPHLVTMLLHDPAPRVSGEVAEWLLRLLHGCQCDRGAAIFLHAKLCSTIITALRHHAQAQTSVPGRHSCAAEAAAAAATAQCSRSGYCCCYSPGASLPHFVAMLLFT